MQDPAVGDLFILSSPNIEPTLFEVTVLNHGEVGMTRHGNEPMPEGRYQLGMPKESFERSLLDGSLRALDPDDESWAANHTCYKCANRASQWVRSIQRGPIPSCREHGFPLPSAVQRRLHPVVESAAHV